MKSKYFILLVCWFMAKNAMAQGDGLFIQAGLNACNITSTGYYTFQKAGLYAAIGKRERSDLFREGYFHYGIAFNQKGARRAADTRNNDLTDYNIRLNYIEVPVSLWLKMRSIKGILGLNLGYLVSSYEKSQFGFYVGNTPAFRKFDFSGTAGVGTSVGEHVLLNLSVSLSVFPIKNTAGTGTLGFSRGPRNTLVNIGVTYVLWKKKTEEEQIEETE